MERSRHFETQHKLLLLETLYDAGLSLGSMPDEEALVEDVLARVVGVLDASRGYLATFADGGRAPRRSASRLSEAAGGGRRRPGRVPPRGARGRGGDHAREIQAPAHAGSDGGGRPDLRRGPADRRARPGGQGGRGAGDRRPSTRRTGGFWFRWQASAAWRSRTAGTSSGSRASANVWKRRTGACWMRPDAWRPAASSWAILPRRGAFSTWSGASRRRGSPCSSPGRAAPARSSSRG